MIDIKSYAKQKDNVIDYLSSSKGFANNTITINGGGSVNSAQGVYLWGNYHDHTQDINGDLTSNGTVKGNSLSATHGISGETLDISNDIRTYTIHSTGKATLGEIESTYADITTVDAGSVIADLGSFTNVQVTDTLTALNAIIDYLTSKEITTEYLTVTKAAHFFKLVIDEIKATQGQIIITPANATIDKVVTLNNGNYKCYFRATDGDKKIYQTFEANDQIVCQTFNAATGTSYNVSNKFYWRLCTQVSSAVEQTEIDGQTVDCHWVILSDTDKDTYSISVPEKGDEIVMLGNRTDSTRQAAITIGAYNNPYLDSGIHAPFIIQYDGINDYNLSTHRKNVISNGFNQLKGQFITNTGDDIEDLINQTQQGLITYMHTAYANSADGTLNFSKTYFTDALYIGFCSNHTESDTLLVYSDYTWNRLKGEDGTDGQSIKLIPVTENVPISSEGTAGVQLSYNIVQYSGTTATTLTANTSNYYVRFKPYYLNTQGSYTNLSTGTTTPSYTNASYQTNWKTINNPLQYLLVELVKGNTVYDKRIVYAQLAPAASFTITDSITSTVQGHDTQINSNTNAISTLQQNYNSINLTVQGHTTSISNLEDDVADMTTDISNLEIRADGISSMVSKYSGVQLINDYGWTKRNGTAAKYNPDTQAYSLEAYTYDGSTYYGIYSNVVKLESGKTYVFSCYSNIPNPPVTVYYSATNKQPVEFSTTVATTLTVYDDDKYLNAKRHAYKFTATSNGYYVIKYGVESAVNNAFYRPQLELGEVPTTYDLNSQMMSSEILQSANNILLQVSSCGINIDESQITLRGNTEIIGNLTLSESDQGFVLVGIGGTTIITPQSIGTYSQFRGKTSTDRALNNMEVSLYFYKPSNTYYYYLFSSRNNLGYIKSGATLTFKNQNIQLLYTDYTTAQTDTFQVTYYVYQNTSLLTSFTNTQLSTSTIGTVTTTADGNVTVNIRIEGTITNYPSDFTNKATDTIYGSIQYSVNIPVMDAFCMLGYDGIGVNYGNNKTVYIGQEGTIIRYANNQGLKVSDSGVQKLNPNSTGTTEQWVGLSTLKVTFLPNSDYTVQDDDELLIASNYTANHTVTLPVTGSGAWKGRIIYVKDYSEKEITISAPNHLKIRNQNGTSSSDTCNNTAQMYIFDGIYWLQYYCG